MKKRDKKLAMYTEVQSSLYFSLWVKLTIIEN